MDGTVGLGGHAYALFARCREIELLGIDRDSAALGLAEKRLQGLTVHLEHCCYADFERPMEKLGWTSLDGVLLDLGVSSMQLDLLERGFSLHGEGRLDMRMDQKESLPTAYDLVNGASFEELQQILANGEEPKATQIARSIVQARVRGPITTTRELAALVVQSYPLIWRKTARRHPATRTFQALRMRVNDELGQLRRFLMHILPYVAPQGRICVLTFHSLEDRMVKRFMQEWAKDCLCPPYVQQCVCGHKAEVQIITKKPLRPGEDELLKNKRAQSAKLRCVEKL